MAVVFLAHNGIGVGHLSRCLALCDAMCELGEAPVVFAQGTLPSLGRSLLAGKKIPKIATASPAGKTAIRYEIERQAILSDPALLIEDTHPCDLKFDPLIRRILIVRPTDFDYLISLQRTWQDTFSGFLIADAPGSPTWVYTETQTRLIEKWPNWFFLGPVFRSPTPFERDAVRARYGIRQGDPVCVLSMGGGGVRSLDDGDLARFIEESLTIGYELKRLEPETRLLFIRGPLAPQELVVPDAFEAVIGEPFVPALMSVARGAIIRPGYNTTWECVSNGIPFTPILGTFYREPMEQRLGRLELRGAVRFDLARIWKDEEWMLGASKRAALAHGLWSGQPDVTILSRILRKAVPHASYGSAKWKPLRAPAENRSRRRLAIRIDDVIELDEPLRWLLDKLISARLHASLEVIPYLSRLCEADLDVIDPEGFLTISQHGYSHVPFDVPGARKAEFNMGAIPTVEEAAVLQAGHDTLSQRFPTRFQGGFSPPFDALPPWFGPLWKELGGQFVSCIWARPRGAQVPIVRVGIETWNWQVNEPVPVVKVIQDFRTATDRNGTAGIVIHPWLLRAASERERILILLEAILEDGIDAVSLSTLAKPAEQSNKTAEQVFVHDRVPGQETAFAVNSPEMQMEVLSINAPQLRSRFDSEHKSPLAQRPISVGFFITGRNSDDSMMFLDLCEEYGTHPVFLFHDETSESLKNDRELLNLCQAQMENIDKELWSRGRLRESLQLAWEQLSQRRPQHEQHPISTPDILFCDSSNQCLTGVEHAIKFAAAAHVSTRLGVPLGLDRFQKDRVLQCTHQGNVSLFGAGAESMVGVSHEVDLFLTERLFHPEREKLVRQACDRLRAFPAGQRQLVLRASKALQAHWSLVERGVAAEDVDACSLEIPFYLNGTAISATEFYDLSERTKDLCSQRGWRFAGGRPDLLSVGLKPVECFPTVEEVISELRHEAPSATIISSIYNASASLPDFLTSLFECRSAAHLEVVLVDDGSTDNTWQIMQEYCRALGNRFSFTLLRLGRRSPYVHDTYSFRTGVARQMALGHARGEVIVFFDSDEIIDKQCIAEHLLSQSRGADVVIGRRTYPGADLVYRTRMRIRHAAPHDFRSMWKRFFTGNSSVSRSILDKARGFDPTLQFWGLDDSDLGYRLHLAGARFCHTPRAEVVHVAAMSSGGGSSSAERAKSRRFQLEVLYRKYLDEELLPRPASHNSEPALDNNR